MALTRKDMEQAWKVTATKKLPDDRLSLCGEGVSGLDDAGREYFIIPAHLSSCGVMLGYEMGAEFLPDGVVAEIPTAPAKRGRPKAE